MSDTSLYRFGISPNKLFDYMNAGKPVILAGDPAHNYVALAKCGITVPSRDPQALADAIEGLASSSNEERRAMGERGRAYVRVHHDWDILVQRLADTLDDVLGSHESGE